MTKQSNIPSSDQSQGDGIASICNVSLIHKRPNYQKAKSLKFKVGVKRSLTPTGEYLAQVMDIDRQEIVRCKPTLVFTFEISEGQFKGEKLRGFVNANYSFFSENTKLFQWYKKATGENPEEGEEIDLSGFFGKILRVTVEEKESRKTGNPFSNVTAILGVHCEL